MAGDWLKMRVDLLTHPKVVRIATGQTCTRFAVVGGLLAVWAVFDAHAQDGELEGYTLESLDEIIGWPGFAASMAAVGWLEVRGQVLVAPEYSEHNGATAKQRAQDTKAKGRKRAGQSKGAPVREMSGTEPDKSRTREEKSINTPKPPTSPAGDAGAPPPPESLPEAPADDGADPPGEGSEGDGKAERRLSLGTWLGECAAAGITPIAEGSAALAYARQIDLPPDFLALHWAEFKARHRQPHAKRYTDWPRAFGNSLRGNWYGLWAVDAAGRFALTSKGHQARLAHADELQAATA